MMEEEQQNDYYNPYGVPGSIQSSRTSTQPPDSSVTKWRMDTEKDILRFCNQLMGKTSVDGKNWVDDENMIKVCGPKGASLARLTLSTAANKSVTQANLIQEHYEVIVDGLVDPLIRKVGTDYFELGIKQEDRELYLSQVTAWITMILTRPLGDKERNYAVEQSKDTFVQRVGDAVNTFRRRGLNGGNGFL